MENSGSIIYTIDFGGNVKAKIEVHDNSITVLNAMNGYGDNISLDEIDISFIINPSELL